jgi:hypothetical protein
LYRITNNSLFSHRKYSILYKRLEASDDHAIYLSHWISKLLRILGLFYEFSIRFWNCADNVVFLFFSLIFAQMVSFYRTKAISQIPIAWCFCVSFYYISLYRIMNNSLFSHRKYSILYKRLEAGDNHTIYMSHWISKLLTNGAAVYQWCGFKSRRWKNKNFTALKSNSNTVWFNFQTYIIFSINLVSLVTLKSSGTDIYRMWTYPLSGKDNSIQER